MRSVLNSKIYIGGIADPKPVVGAEDFAGADWVEIDGWTDRGPLGDVQAVGTQSRINRRRILKYKTTRSVNAMENQFIPMPLDPGQIRFKQAVASCRPYQFRIDTPGECGEEPEIEMFIGLALPGARQGGPNESAHIRSWSIAPLSNIYEYPAMFLNAIFANNSALRSLLQNADGTGPVHAPGTPIGMAVDQSGHGNDAVQVVGTARPLLRVFPRGGVRNLLAKFGASSEKFGAGKGWYVHHTLEVEDHGEFVDGRPAQRIVYNSSGSMLRFLSCRPAGGFWPIGEAGRTVSALVDVSNLANKVATLQSSAPTTYVVFTWTGPRDIVITSTGTAAGSAVVKGDYQAEITGVMSNAATGASELLIYIGAQGVSAGEAGEYALITAVQPELGTARTPYQQVISQHEIHQSGVPDIYAPLFDGADDWLGNMLDAPVDISQTGAVIACVVQLSEIPLVVNQTPVALGNTGVNKFAQIFVNSANQQARLSISGTNTVEGGIVDSSLTIFIAIVHKDGGITLRQNGVVYTNPDTVPACTVNKFSVGSLDTTTIGNFFNGTIPESLFKIGTVTDAQIQQLERQWSNKYGVPLA